MLHYCRKFHIPLVVAIVTAVFTGQSAFAQSEALQHRMLNPIEKPAFPGIGAWKVSGLKTRIAEGVEPRLGAVAIEISGQSEVSGGKVDAPAFEGELAGCRRLSVWIAPTQTANVDRVGFQILDAKGEWLLQTVALDWTGWKRLDIDPSAGEMKQAYAQKDHDGKVDFPIKRVNLIWFAADTGPTSLIVDGLTALAEPAGNASGVAITLLGADVVEPGIPLTVPLIAENHDAAAQSVTVKYSLQVNSAYTDPVLPHPVLGFDHAIGAVSTVTIDGKEQGDAKLTDNDESTGFETPWGSGAREVVATIDLGLTRDVTGVQWQAGDANWIFKADVLTSLDGVTYTPVAGAQNVDLHKKWGGPHAFPWDKPITARHLRFRFHKDGEASNTFRLPTGIMVYDGIENDELSVPRVGEVVASGEAEASVPAGGFSELSLRGEALRPGAYLLGLDIAIGDRHQTQWSNLFVLPDDTVNADRARRFGINGSAADAWMAENMRRCGFGWMRFENAKWMMYMPEPDRVAFDGTVAPWHVNHDLIFSQYHQNDLHVLPYVFQVPQWAQSVEGNVKNPYNYPPKNNADYGEAIFQIVARYGQARVDPALLKSADKKTGLGWINAIELWNEPNLSDPGWGPWVGTMEQYFETMRAGVDGARRADPSLPVTSAGFAGIKLEIAGQMSEYKYDDGRTPLDLVDVINVHFYSGRSEPEIAGWDPNVERGGPSGGGMSYPEQLADLVAWRDQLKPEAEIWITETGNDVGGPIGRSERHQAAKVPRGIMLALASGVERVFIYREAGSTPAQHAGAGLLRNDRTIRPSWITTATMIRQLQGFEGKALRLPSENPDVWMFLWEDGDRRLLTAWTIGDATPLGIELGGTQVCDAFGRKTTPASTADLPLGYFPIYITVNEATPALNSLIAQAQADVEQEAARRSRLAGISMTLLDFGPAAHVGMLKGYGLPRRFTPVDKDETWDDARGYGFTSPGRQNDDAHWVRDPLERDGVRIDPGNAFRLRLAPGRYALRVRANSVNAAQPVDITVKSVSGEQTIQASPEAPIATFTVVAGEEPIQISFNNWSVIRWLTAMPAE